MSHVSSAFEKSSLKKRERIKFGASSIWLRRREAHYLFIYLPFS